MKKEKRYWCKPFGAHGSTCYNDTNLFLKLTEKEKNGSFEKIFDTMSLRLDEKLKILLSPRDQYLTPREKIKVACETAITEKPGKSIHRLLKAGCKFAAGKIKNEQLIEIWRETRTDSRNNMTQFLRFENCIFPGNVIKYFQVRANMTDIETIKRAMEG